MANIGAGTLRHRVVVQRNDYSQNQTTGAMETHWHTVGTVWAAVQPVSGRQYIQSAAAQTDVSVRITVRYRDFYVAGMRIVHRNKYYVVKAVLEDAQSGLEHITLMCSQGTRVD